MVKKPFQIISNSGSREANKVWFWLDTWVGKGPLANKLSALF